MVPHQPERILLISYDESLLLTRRMILKQAGYEVTAALGFTESMEICSAEQKFDLIIMGYTIPRKDKAALVAAVRPKCKAPVLSIRRGGDEPLPEADASVDSLDGPIMLIEAVKAVISNKNLY
jgi:PleD family two-component response regulator